MITAAWILCGFITLLATYPWAVSESYVERFMFVLLTLSLGPVGLAMVAACAIEDVLRAIAFSKAGERRKK